MQIDFSIIPDTALPEAPFVIYGAGNIGRTIINVLSTKNIPVAAWLDRHTVTSKDAEDMACIMACYFAANCSRNPHSEVYEWPDFDIGKAGAYWLGLDLSVLLTSEQRAYYRKCIEKEIKNPGGSALFDLKDVFGTSYEHLRSQWECLVKAL